MKFKKYVLQAVALAMLAIVAVTVVSCGDDDPAPAKSSEKEILSFSFQALSPVINAQINGTNITAQVAFGTDVTNLVPTITLSTLATVNPGTGVAQNFTNPVSYTVTAEDGTSQVYTVTVTVASSSSKDMLAFVFGGFDPAITAELSGNNVTATVPFGTNVTALVPTITVSPLANVSPASGEAQNFTNPVVYTVTAQDGSTAQYTVTVNFQPNTANDILTFIFEAYDPDVVGVISGTNITLTLPAYQADISALVPTITLSENATVNPASGEARDFTNPVTYTVTAESGAQKAYSVRVVVPSPPLNITGVWEQTHSNENWPTWLDGGSREVVLTGSQLWVSTGNNAFRVTNAATGPADGDASKSVAHTGGTFVVCGADADNQGRVVASNLAVANKFRVSKWEAPDYNQVEILDFDAPTGTRLGDNIRVKGDINGSATIYAPNQTANGQIYKFAVTDGVVNPEPTTVTLAGVLWGSSPHVSVDSQNGNIFAFGGGVNGLKEYTSAGAEVALLPAALAGANNDYTNPYRGLFNMATQGEVFYMNGRRYLAAVSTESFGDPGVIVNPTFRGAMLYIVDITKGLNTVTAADIFYVRMAERDNPNRNTNATAGIHVVVNGNSARIYAMVTLSGIGAYDVTFANN
jgi:hypothetical protein